MNPTEPETVTAADQALMAVRARMADILGRSDPVLADVLAHLQGSSGKQVRAALLVAASADETGAVTDEAINAAAALELLHLATLVHDDVIDDAPTRRGQPSIQARFGKKTAVITGDYLFCLCFSLVSDLPLRFADRFAVFSRAMTAVCVGELNQYKHNRDVQLSVLGYLRIIAGKTAALFTLALYAGAALRGADEQTCRLFGRIGYQIGMLFQLVDDCLDYEASPQVLKKSAKHDLAEGVVTLPLIYALQQRRALQLIVQQSRLSAQAIHDTVAEVVLLGGVSHTRRMAEQYYHKACRLLESVEPAGKRSQIRAILDAVRDRRH